MTGPPRSPRRRTDAARPRLIGLLAAALLAVSAPAAPASAESAPASAVSAAAVSGSADSAAWEWPLSSSRVTAPYRQPAHRYAEGHRGIDLGATEGLAVRAPDEGIVAFAGEVGGRPVLTIDHGDGLVSTLEPVAAVVAPGDRVARGAIVGLLSAGGHATPGELHLGARVDGEYLNPLVLLGGVPRAVLLPCC